MAVLRALALVIAFASSLALLVACTWGREPARELEIQASPTAGPYSPSPDDPWNRVHRALFLRVGADGREQGMDELDPLLWPSSTYLLESPRYEQVREALRGFLEAHAEKLVSDPVRRAMFLRDLWAFFDWCATHHVDGRYRPTTPTSDRDLELAKDLMRVMQRIALSPEEIQRLPDTLADSAKGAHGFPEDLAHLAPDEPFLPADLLDPDGPWVAVVVQYPFAGELIAPRHTEHFQSRSVFTVHLRLPGGRQAALDYLEKLHAFPERRVKHESVEHEAGLFLNPKTPQLPVGSAVALVRRAVVFDGTGRLFATRLVESVQIRLFRTTEMPIVLGDVLDVARASQDLVEWELDRNALFAARGGALRAIGRAEKSFQRFLTFDSDPFGEHAGFSDEQVRLDTCMGCHGAPGIFSIQSYTRMHTGAGTHFLFPAVYEPATLAPVRIGDLDPAALDAKTRRYEWGLLQGLMTAERR